MTPLKRLLFLALVAPALAQADAGLFRWPSMSRNRIAFVYARDLWTVPRQGGQATRVTQSKNVSSGTAFSPDGRMLAFMADWEGNHELYTMPLGGQPRRLTFMPRGKALCQWIKGNRLLFSTNTLSFAGTASQFCTVGLDGGMPERLPVHYGVDGAISPNGRWIAYTHFSNFAIDKWKRYEGGMQNDIWLFDLQTKKARRLTTWRAMDGRPMWDGDNRIVYVSDEGQGRRLNLWSLDVKSGRRKQLTHLTGFDVGEPSVGPGREIVFRHGLSLQVYSLATGKLRKVDVRLPENVTSTRRDVDAARWLASVAPSPDGRSALVEARGDLWLIRPDAATNLTKTSGVFERSPSCSPDGRNVAYISDEGGEYQIYVRPLGGGGPRKLTAFKTGFVYDLVWSPDSSRISFVDHTNTLWVLDTGTSKLTKIDQSRHYTRPTASWSSDSRLLAYTNTLPTRAQGVFVRDMATGKTWCVSEGAYRELSPVFSRDGKTLYFVSGREMSVPDFDDLDNRFVHGFPRIVMSLPVDVIRRGGTPQSLSWRATRAGGTPGRMTLIGTASDGKLLYFDADYQGNAFIKALDPKTERVMTVRDGGFSSVSLTPDGARLIIVNGRNVEVFPIEAAAKAEATLTIGTLPHMVDTRAEWRQMFNDQWRLYRDIFYDPHMHGLSWPGMKAKYKPLVEAAVTRDDINFVLSEMIGELSVGHAWITNGGDVDRSPSVPLGVLGADYELVNGAFRFKKIYRSPWWHEVKAPLDAPGISVREGEYLLAVDGKSLNAQLTPGLALLGLAGKPVKITVGPKPVADAQSRVLTVTPVGDEGDLRYRDWIRARAAMVEKATKGRVGYLYISGLSFSQMEDFMRQYRLAASKEALIVDVRWSQGGFLGDVYAQMLSRKPLNYGGLRYGDGVPAGGTTLKGPQCLLVNGSTISAGENFAYYYRKLGNGKILGSRTWGGLVGLNGSPSLIDGGAVLIPNAPFYDNGQWIVEGKGVVPDIPVADSQLAGEDPQLRAAIKHILGELKRNPPKSVIHPPYEDRSGR